MDPPPFPGKAHRNGKKYPHNEDTAPFTQSQKTSIQMPNLEQEQIYHAIFVLEKDISIDMINEVLEKVSKEGQSFSPLWLASKSLDHLSNNEEPATKFPIPSSWRSPFVGKTVKEAFEFVSEIPLDVSVTRRNIIVLHKCLYEKGGWVMVYDIDEEGEITCAPCRADKCALYLDSYRLEQWPMDVEDWRVMGRPLF